MPVNLVNQNFDIKTANAPLPMKWLRFVVKFLIPFQLTVGSIITFGNCYNSVNDFYDGNFLLYLSFVPNLLELIVWMVSFVLKYKAMNEFLHLSANAVKLFKLNFVVLFVGYFAVFIFYLPYMSAFKALSICAPQLIANAFMYIANSVYFSKRMFLFEKDADQDSV